VNAQSLIGIKLGNFRLERLLGRGRMGIVYLAHDEALLRPTAVKILSWSLPAQHGLDPEAWFLAEARNVARIDHPHVIRIYGVAKHAPHCYIAMEYVNGATADDWVSRHGPFSARRATEILLQAASALQAAHDAKIVHRDIKPGNLLIDAEGGAKLGDFGMAMSLSRDANREAARAGTPHYTAPEIWRGHVATPATDIYALGATFFYLLTGRPPFDASTLEELTDAHLHAPVPDPNDYAAAIPPGCHQLIERCMAKSAGDRYASAQVLGWEVRGVVRELNSLAPAPRQVMRAEAERRRSSPAGEQRGSQPFGFRVEPFQSIEPLSAPAIGEPFRSTRDALRAALRDEASHCVLLSGAPGSGKTTLAQQLMAECMSAAPLAVVSNDEPSKSLQQQVARAFGIVPLLASRANAEIDGLLEELERTQRGPASPAWLVLDNLRPSRARLGELWVLMQAASKTKSFRMLVLATPELEDGLARAATRERQVEPLRVSLPPLTPRQTLDYMAAWLQAVRTPSSPPVVITPDAALLVAHESGGSLVRINEIARAMLQRAWSERRLVLSSWDAWSAAREVAAPGAPAQRARPRDWPTKQVLEILNAERHAAGIPWRQ
jgi:serine/threonine protein kinase